MKDCSIIINARVNSSRMSRKIVRPFAYTTLLDIALNNISNLPVHKYLAAYSGEQEIMDIYDNYQDVIDFLPRTYESVKQGKVHQKITFQHYANVPTKYIMMINPCSPLSSTTTYNDALDYFSKSTCNTLTSVIKRDNIFFDHNHTALNTSSYDVSTQGNKCIYEMAHLFHIFDKEYFLKHEYFWDYSPNNPYLYPVELETAMDIDNQLDFDICEFLYLQRQNNEETNSTNSQ